MFLKNLIKNLSKKNNKIKIKGLSINSKNIKRGYIFFAIKGNKFNGEKYINEAIRNGAVAVVCSKKCKYINSRIPIIKTKNLRFLLSEVCSKFYKSKPKNIFAVTGTNGKTSVAELFYQILRLNNLPVASIGTLGIKYKSKIIKSDNTTPDTILLHKELEKIKKSKIDNVIVETSSHGLHQKRVDHLNFHAGIFTNFSQDHLDYHKTFKSYLNAKLSLFKNLLSERKTIISDKFIKEFSLLKKISRKKNLRLVDINSIKEKIKMNKKLDFFDFNLTNLSMAIAAARLCNLNEKKIFDCLHKIKNVNGRLELVKTFANDVKVFVDFAHTPDALQKSLTVLKNYYGENITLVFGCGGERDIKKRPLMAKVASSICKKIYVTDDNPRGEKPENIRKQILNNIKIKNRFEIGDRNKAIKTAISQSSPQEIIIIAGKGHEEKQVYKNKVILTSDKKVVKSFKFKKRKISNIHQTFNQNKKIFYQILGKNVTKNFHGLSIDTRFMKKNNIFLTIKGKNSDGIKFIQKAFAQGASYVVSSKNNKKYKKVMIKVNNETDFLNSYAKLKREETSAKIFAITGSAGKTSLKNLIKDLLQSYGKTLGSPKSYNNHFGVPLSLSNLSTNHRFGVFEVGMSKPGEISALTKLIRPHIAIITNIGEAHIENFKNLKGIADAKGEIINHIENGGTLILNYDDKFYKYLNNKAQTKRIKVISFGMSKKSDVHPISIKKSKMFSKLIIKAKSQIFHLKIKDINIYNVLSSLALLVELNFDVNKVLNFYNNHEPSEGRGKIFKVKRYNRHFNLIDESYNANPLSVKNAIKNFSSIKKQNFKKYLLLGDMLELGKKSDFLHKNLSKVINKSDIDKVFVKGNKSIITYKNLNKKKRGNILQNEEDLDFTLNNFISKNDYLMIKGSNATGLNNLSKRIIRGY